MRADVAAKGEDAVEVDLEDLWVGGWVCWLFIVERGEGGGGGGVLSEFMIPVWMESD